MDELAPARSNPRNRVATRPIRRPDATADCVRAGLSACNSTMIRTGGKNSRRPRPQCDPAQGLQHHHGREWNDHSFYRRHHMREELTYARSLWRYRIRRAFSQFAWEAMSGRACATITFWLFELHASD